MYSITGEAISGPSSFLCEHQESWFPCGMSSWKNKLWCCCLGVVMLFKRFILFLFLQLYIFWVDTKFWLTGFDGILNLFSLHTTAKRQVFLMRKHTVFPCPRGSGCLHGVWRLVLCHMLPSLSASVEYSLWCFLLPMPFHLSLFLLLTSWHSCDDLNPFTHHSLCLSLTHHNSTLWSSNPIQLGQESFSTDAYLNYKMCTSLSSDHPAYRQMTAFKYHLIQW